MTNMEAVQTVNSLCSNQVDDAFKMQWLDELDGLVSKELHMAYEGLPVFENTDPGAERTLLVQAPYNDIYRYYLEMMIHSVTGEISKYNAALERFRSSYKAYGDYLSRSNRGKSYVWKLF